MHEKTSLNNFVAESIRDRVSKERQDSVGSF